MIECSLMILSGSREDDVDKDGSFIKDNIMLLGDGCVNVRVIYQQLHVCISVLPVHADPSEYLF